MGSPRERKASRSLRGREVHRPRAPFPFGFLAWAGWCCGVHLHACVKVVMWSCRGDVKSSAAKLITQAHQGTSGWQARQPLLPSLHGSRKESFSSRHSSPSLTSSFAQVPQLQNGMTKVLFVAICLGILRRMTCPRSPGPCANVKEYFITLFESIEQETTSPASSGRLGRLYPALGRRSPAAPRL